MGAWAFSTIAGLLKNEIYIGKLNFGKRTYNPKRATKGSAESYWIKNDNYISVTTDKIPPIIPEEMFERVKNLRLSKTVSLSGVSGRSSNNEHLLTSMLRCKNCGHGMYMAGPQKPNPCRNRYDSSDDRIAAAGDLEPVFGKAGDSANIDIGR